MHLDIAKGHILYTEMSWIFPTALFSPDPILYTLYLKGSNHLDHPLLVEPVHNDRDKPVSLQIHWEKGESYIWVRHKYLEADSAAAGPKQLSLRTNTSFYREREIPFLFSPTFQPIPNCLSIFFLKNLHIISGCLLHPLLFLECPNGAPLLLLFSLCVTAGWSLIQQISLCRW